MFVLYTFLSLYTIKARLCDPYAFRLSLGHYYTILNYTGDVLRVSFNSEVNVLHLIRVHANLHLYCKLEIIKSLNMKHQ